MICLITQHHSPIYFSTRFTRRESKTVDPFRTSEFIRSFWWSSYNFTLVFWGSVLRKWLLVVSCFWLSLASSQSLVFFNFSESGLQLRFYIKFCVFLNKPKSTLTLSSFYRNLMMIKQYLLKWKKQTNSTDWLQIQL